MSSQRTEVEEDFRIIGIKPSRLVNGVFEHDSDVEGTDTKRSTNSYHSNKDNRPKWRVTSANKF